jgi:hypothetical protein
MKVSLTWSPGLRTGNIWISGCASAVSRDERQVYRAGKKDKKTASAGPNVIQIEVQDSATAAFFNNAWHARSFQFTYEKEPDMPTYESLPAESKTFKGNLYQKTVDDCDWPEKPNVPLMVTCAQCSNLQNSAKQFPIMSIRPWSHKAGAADHPATKSSLC